MNVVAQTVSGWFTADDRIRARLRAVAQHVVQHLAVRSHSGPPPAPMSATRSVRDSSISRGSSPGESPAPPLSFPTAAGWLPLTPAERTAPAAPAPPALAVPTVEQRASVSDRRFTERRIRDDGSPYGVERRSGAETRAGERRVAESASPRPSRVARSGARGPHAHDFDYVPHLPDLLARFHGR